MAGRWQPAQVHRDRAGAVRVITPEPTYDRLVQRAFEKIRQSSRGNPAVLIRLLDALTRIMERTTAEDQRRVLLDQAAMIIQASEESVPDAPDRADVRRAVRGRCSRSAPTWPTSRWPPAAYASWRPGGGSAGQASRRCSR